MAFCPSCGSGYTARATRCASCDVALVPRTQLTPADDGAAPDEAGEGHSTIALCRLDDRVTAELLRMELEQADVPHLWRRVPVHLLGAAEVLECRVPAKWLEDAQAVLRQVEERERGRPMEEGHANG